MTIGENMPIKLKRAEGKVDLSEWTLSVTENLSMITSQIPAKIEEAIHPILDGIDIEGAVLAAATEAIQLAIDAEVLVDLSIIYNHGDKPSNGRGGPPVEDAMMMCVSIPLGGVDDPDPHFEFNFRDCVKDAINYHANPKTGEIDPEAHQYLIAIRDGLRELADKLDAALTE